MTLQERLNLRMSLMGYDPVINLSESEEIETVSEEVTESYSGKVPFWKKSELSEAIRAEYGPSTSRERAVGLGAVSGELASIYPALKVAAKGKSAIKGGLAGAGVLAGGTALGGLAGLGVNKLTQSKKDRQKDLKHITKYGKSIGDDKLYSKTKEKLQDHRKKYGNLTKNENINTTDILEKDFNTVGKVNIKKGKYRIL